MKKQALKKSTLSAVEAPVKDSLSPDYNEDLEIIEAIYLASNFASRENSAQSSSYGKMFPVLSRRTKVEILRESSPNLQGGKILKIVNGGGAGYLRNCGESDYSVSYRILDTRFFGIPQRRRRIYLVASLGSACRPEILFEREGVRGNIASGGTAGKNIAAFANQGIGAYNQSRNAATLRIGGDIKGGGGTLIAETPVGKTLTAGNRYDAETENFIVFENNSQDSRIKESGSIAPTLSAKMGTGGNNTPICVHASQDPICSTEHAHALGAKSSQAVCIAENVIGRKEINGGNGVGAKEEIAYTLNATGVHGVAFSQNQIGEIRGGNISPTLNTNSNASGRNVSMLPDTLGVRRLTPLECERLQGFPDNWTRIPYRGKSAEKCPDSPRYKACGNAITVDVGEWVLRRLISAIENK